ncbi:MAG: TolC family protein [Deltaproteobacteria bacterium]|nr:TolC family protein [Deltaproteobacteria bacterium]MBW2152711.1 TolC family protein [Deltaproteobacteria bacterium]
MSRKSILILGLIMGISTFARGGYRDLKEAYDSYGPSVYLQDQFRPPPERIEPVAIDREFARTKKRIEAIKNRWQTSLEVEEDEMMFFRPDSRLLSSLSAAGKDMDAASNALSRTYTLKTLEVLTLLRNPGIKAAENRFRGTVESFTQVAELDEILRQYSAFTEQTMIGVGPMKGKEPMVIKFPFPGILSLKGEIVNQEVSVDRQRLEAVRRDAVTSVRKAYWNLVYMIKATRITAEMVELLHYLEMAASSRYEAGKTSYQDVIKVRINRKTLEEDLITLKEQKRNLEARIREIVNLPAGVKLGQPKTVSPLQKVPSLKPLYKMAKQRRQELRQLRARVGKMERMIEMAETMVLPPYTLKFSFYEDEAVTMVGSQAQRSTFAVTTEASRGAGLPKMPWYGSEDAYLRETRQKLSALKDELRKAEVLTNTLVRNAWFELDRAKRETSLYYDEVVKLSRSALDVSSRGYESGNVTFADVIDSYTIWLKANLALERNRSDLGIALAVLEQVVGISPVTRSKER